MNIVQKVETWGDTHQSKWFALIRIILGMIIFFKGLFFVQNTDAINAMIANSAIDLYAVFLAHYVALAHLVGGVLIILGLITRVAVLFQVPILLGAVIFINAQRGLYSIHSELGFSILVLAMLLFFLVFGSGKISVDDYMRKNDGA
jgi:putative oxidoreductase